jgi:Raf kinase inhibitor-like YbhB/YbcL family protein
MPDKKRVIEVLVGPKTIGVQSPAFAPGARIPKRYTADGEGTSPPLTWLNVPREAKGLALLVEDPDASTPQPFVHWVAYNIPGGSEGLPEAIPHGDRPGRPAGMRQGSSGPDGRGWIGCAPPAGTGTHRYHFELFALDTLLDLPDGATRADLAKGIRGHLLATGELVGTYSRDD